MEREEIHHLEFIYYASQAAEPTDETLADFYIAMELTLIRSQKWGLILWRRNHDHHPGRRHRRLRPQYNPCGHPAQEARRRQDWARLADSASRP